MKKMLLSLTIISVFALAEPIVLKTQILDTVTTTSALKLAANSNRKYLLIINNGTSTIFVKGGSAHTSTEGVPITAGGNWEPFQCPIDALYIKAASGTQSVSIIEGN